VCDLESIGVSSILKTIRSSSDLTRMLSILDLIREDTEENFDTELDGTTVVELNTGRFRNLTS
jgi:hypothetical protein